MVVARLRGGGGGKVISTNSSRRPSMDEYCTFLQICCPQKATYPSPSLSLTRVKKAAGKSLPMRHEISLMKSNSFKNMATSRAVRTASPWGYRQSAIFNEWPMLPSQALVNIFRILPKAMACELGSDVDRICSAKKLISASRFSGPLLLNLLLSRTSSAVCFWGTMTATWVVLHQYASTFCCFVFRTP